MAKTKKKPDPPTEDTVATATPAPPDEPLTPQRVCELLGLPTPIDPPRPPAPWPGYATFWDPGQSIADLKRKHPAAFHPWLGWYDGLPFARATDVSRWRQLRLEPILLAAVYADQQKLMPNGDEVPLAREVVTFLLIRFLATGERWPGRVLRCRDALPSGQRVLVGPFWDSGFELTHCGDGYRSPGLGLAAVHAPAGRR